MISLKMKAEYDHTKERYRIMMRAVFPV